MNRRNLVLTIALAVFVQLGNASSARAAQGGYWRCEGTAGGAVGTVPNVLSPGTLDGAGEGSAVYGASVIGPTIWDPISGTTYSNSTSLAIDGAKQVRVADDAALDAPDFTIEAFIKTGLQTGYPGYVSHMIINNQGWQLDIDPDEDARTRFDTTAQINQTAGSGTGQRLADQRWHHTAVTFNGTSKLITHYTDYGVTATRTLNGTASEATSVAADLLFGANAAWPAGSYVDEIRYSNSVLTDSQFLRSVGNALWRFEGTPGATIGSVPNALNPGNLDGAGEAGALFAADVPDNYTYDPITDTNWINTSSMDMSNAGAVRVLDADELDAPAFTIEAFVKVQNQGGYPNFVSRLSGSRGWQLDMDPQEEARARADTAAQTNQWFGSGAAQSLADGGWHHVALTFEGDIMRLYVDGGNMATRTLNGLKADMTSVVNDLLMGSPAFPSGSYVDEVRFSASVLSPSQFLTASAVPEPSTFALAAIGLVGLMAWGRRKRRTKDES